MYTIDRKRLIVVSIPSSAYLIPKKHIGLFSGHASAEAFRLMLVNLRGKHDPTTH